MALEDVSPRGAGQKDNAISDAEQPRFVVGG
jgi:hypothetical protein